MPDHQTESPTPTTATVEAPRGEPLLELDNVSQVFRVKGVDLPAVSEVSLTLHAGEVVCLVGESGSGKTTTARLAAGLARPTGGEVRFQGDNLAGMPREEWHRYRRAVQYIHQDPYASLNPIRSIRGTLAVPLRRHGLAATRDEVDAKVDELLTTVDLTPPSSYRAKFPHQLSGGQRQRVSVARSLTLSPKVLIADESTSMLDVSIRVGLLNMLGRLRTETGVAFMFITHDLAIAKYFAWSGRTAVMYLGRIVEIGPTPQIINNPQHPYTKALLEAVPEPDPDLTRQKKPGGGLRSSEIPSLANLPSGCTFHPRCPLAEERCALTEPQLLPSPASRPGSPHDVACMVVTDPQGDQGGADR